jgi:parallel beta-helix repeat protein
MERRNSRPLLQPKKSALIICLLLVVLSFHQTEPVSAATIRVGPTGPPTYDYAKIQDAVDHAGAGDTIEVAPGIYREHIIIEKSLTIVGNTTNPATTIVDGTANGTVFYLKKDASNVNIRGLTIRNGGDNSNAILWENENPAVDNIQITNNIITTSQYGIYVFSSDQNKIFNNTFDNNAFGAIYLNTAKNNNITRNTITNSAYGIQLILSINNNITQNTITQTSYAIHLTQTSTGNTIRQNVLSGKTAGIYSGSDSTIIHHNTITDGAYGIYFYNCRYGSIYYNILSNSATGIRLYYSSSSPSNHNVRNNKITTPNGWGIELTNVNGNTFTGNWLQEGSWGVYISSSGSNTLYRNNFVQNHRQAYNNGGGNLWDQNGEGNYWSDYNGTGVYRLLPTGTDNYPLKTTWSEHDISLVSVTPSTNSAGLGSVVNITVTARNNANITVSETFTVTAKYNSTIIGTQTVPNLAKGATQDLTFSWNTTGVASGNYTISAEASTVPDELNTDNNNHNDGTVKIEAPILGDINGDGAINNNDLTLLLQAFGATSSSPGWNPEKQKADLNQDNIVDALDLYILGKYYEEIV